MKIIDPAHTYQITGGQHITFIKRENGELINNGTTNEEILEILIDRTVALNAKFPCIENDAALHHLQGALRWFNDRTAKRIAQGVETQDKAHVS
jgi:hypothetical protein